MMTDPIADMLTRIRNAQKAEKISVSIPKSKMKQAIAEVLKSEGFIDDVESDEQEGKPAIKVTLRYFEGEGVITNLKRISKPGLRVYKPSDEIPSVNNGLGIAIVSTNKGIITDKAAREAGVGGEILCTVS